MYFLADIGGTKTRVGASKDRDIFDRPLLYSTPKSYDEAMEKLIGSILGVTARQKLNAGCVGIAGTFDQETGQIVSAPNLSQDWIGRNIKADIEAQCGCKVYIENDTVIVGLGETVYGAGKDYEIVAYLTISSGVGGVKIENGRIDQKIVGFEPGHQIIDFDPMSQDHRYITVEDKVSGQGFHRAKTEEAFTLEQEETFWEDAHEYLSVGINNTILHWSPSVVILGGGVVNSGRINIERIKDKLQEIYIVPEKLPEIKKAELGDFGGLYGGIEYIRQQEKADGI